MPRRREMLQLMAHKVRNLESGEAGGVPESILSLEACGIVSALSALYPSLWTEFGRDLQKRARNGLGRCADCGETQIPALLTHPVTCAGCFEDYAQTLAQMDIDPNEPHSPEIESLLVDATNEQRQLVNNLDCDYLDQLERMLEHRKIAD